MESGSLRPPTACLDTAAAADDLEGSWDLYWNDALSAAIEVAIAMVGFSGIVAAFSRRSPGAWTTADQLRMQILLTAGGFSGGSGFFPSYCSTLALLRSSPGGSAAA